MLARSDARRTHLLEESKKQLHASLHEKDIKANDAFSTFDTDKNGTMDRPVNSPSPKVRFLPVSQYLLELASGIWVLECGVLTSREAWNAYRTRV